jgi:hypothetical protein
MTNGTAKKMDRKNWNTYRSVDGGDSCQSFDADQERTYQIRRRKGGQWESRALLGGKLITGSQVNVDATTGELRYQDAKRRAASAANIDTGAPADMLDRARAAAGMAADANRKPPQAADDDPLPTWAVGDTRDAQAFVEDSHEIMILR